MISPIQNFREFAAIKHRGRFTAFGLEFRKYQTGKRYNAYDLATGDWYDFWPTALCVEWPSQRLMTPWRVAACIATNSRYDPYFWCEPLQIFYQLSVSKWDDATRNRWVKETLSTTTRNILR